MPTCGCNATFRGLWQRLGLPPTPGWQLQQRQIFKLHHIAPRAESAAALLSFYLTLLGEKKPSTTTKPLSKTGSCGEQGVLKRRGYVVFSGTAQGPCLGLFPLLSPFQEAKWPPRTDIFYPPAAVVSLGSVLGQQFGDKTMEIHPIQKASGEIEP